MTQVGAVLSDISVDKEARRARAHGLIVLGRIFQGEQDYGTGKERSCGALQFSRSCPAIGFA